MNLNFGLGDYDFGDYSPDDSTADPTETYFEKARKAMLARQMLQEQMTTNEQPPADVKIPRIQNEAEAPSFFQKHPGGAKAVDIAARTLALISNLRQIKANEKAGRRGQRTRLINTSNLPSIYGEVEKKNALQNKSEQDIQEQNSRIAEAESRINSNAMSRYATRRTAEMGQMVPSITKAAFREPRVEKSSALQQRLDAYDRFADANRVPPEERAAAKKHILVGTGDTRTPEQKASDAIQAHMAVMEQTDKYRIKNPKPGSSLDATERNRQIAARYAAELQYNDYMEPGEATKRAVAMFRALEGGLGADARNSLGEPAPGTSGALPPGVPASPAGGSYQQPTVGAPLRLKAAAASLDPSLSHKLAIYARLAGDPALRAQMKAALMQEGIDPDLYLEPGQ